MKRLLLLAFILQYTPDVKYMKAYSDAETASCKVLMDTIGRDLPEHDELILACKVGFNYGVRFYQDWSNHH